MAAAPSPEPRRVAVTGSSGFVGRHLLKALDAAGVPAASFHRSRPEPAPPSDRAWEVVDPLDPSSVTAALRRSRATALIHLAGMRAPAGAPHGASATAEANFAAAAVCLEAAMEAGLRRVVLLGSAEEYGPQAGPLREDAPLDPRTPYGISKAAATSMALALHRGRACPVVVLRAFSVYGPHQPAHMFVAEAIACAVGRQPFRMTAGEQKRDLVYVEDVVTALLAALDAPGVEGHVLNVGSGTAHRLRDVAALIWRLSGTDAPLLVGERPAVPEELYDTWADVTRAADLLGWRPRVPLERGLADTIGWAARA